METYDIVAPRSLAEMQAALHECKLEYHEVIAAALAAGEGTAAWAEAERVMTMLDWRAT